ncbi:MAG: ATP-binding protein [bacterium]
MKTRYLQGAVAGLCFADHKMAFVSGPRQCGKTTLAKAMLAKRENGVYHNWDEVTFRRQWVKDPRTTLPVPGAAGCPLVVYDEIHKAKTWKRSLKGVFDTLVQPVDILVTGSARLNVYRRGENSLVGRYHHFRLHPFSVREALGLELPNPDDALKTVLMEDSGFSADAEEAFESMFRYGMFPEPFLAQDDRKARLWRRARVERVIREDLRDLSRTLELSQVEMLASLLPERVGSPLPITALNELLEVSHGTVKRWLSFLKELYYAFELKPYHNHVTRSLRKEGKFYLWDASEVPDDAARLENLIACHLLKACQLWTDCGEGDFDLYYLRDKQKNEIDFLITRDKQPWLPVEVKLTKPGTVGVMATPLALPAVSGGHPGVQPHGRARGPFHRQPTTDRHERSGLVGVFPLKLQPRMAANKREFRHEDARTEWTPAYAHAPISASVT